MKEMKGVPQVCQAKLCTVRGGARTITGTKVGKNKIWGLFNDHETAHIRKKSNCGHYSW